MELWFTEKQTADYGITAKITKTLHTEQTEFQDLAVIDTNEWGRMLVLDGCVMTTIRDEFVYHEMISHIALSAHPNPQKVLVVGGGDGGVMREIIKHKTVQKAVLAEIDGRVIELSKQYLPEIAVALTDPRIDVRVIDGIAHVKEHKQEYDVIIVDSTDPIGPAVGLFAKEFYENIYAALKEDGIFVAQSESPFMHGELIGRVQKDVSAIFPITRLYLASIPTYPSGLWSFTIGSKRHDPLQIADEQRASELVTRYYTPSLHRAAFTLPAFVEELVK
ncbi:polyamine aminopropyltransferase [Sulfoacidibacillus ferrooxidans]|uniref:Polyamine aminopropyltransferase n=1 Tax=Sulfoacidibacillus ferrooxidans TaxID=2005001 RepID=A0A9X1V9R3_9BACL|nr:polyamine aminopropyltransferase [Sulfoacidibacillus ferrooxidans]MCI0183320.1 Polyamine aminopropyltransferase [Sulfoacidibacillus ferrooxidans]